MARDQGIVDRSSNLSAHADQHVLASEQGSVTGDGAEQKVPGSSKIACTTHVPSGGTGGMTYGGDHGEFAYVRVSCHVFIVRE